MSIFSGNCDVYDSLISIRNVTCDDDYFKIKLYQTDKNNNRINLNIKNYKDLVPYSSHIIKDSFIDNLGFMNAEVSEKSCVDIKNEEKLHLMFKWAKKEYKRCKRNQSEFDISKTAKQISFNNVTPSAIEICNRVKEHPYAKDNINGLFCESLSVHKEELIKEMIKVGYTEEQAKQWCYNNKKTW